MHIDSITITGFKSYREPTVAGPFSPGHNVVVGRNGAGKSNFFDAICFVLSDKFTFLSESDRRDLLHEGAGMSVLSASVEVVFDNSDGRLPFESEKVYLRRTITIQKDDYFLDRKAATRAEVFGLFESAGFSRSNPYYIVQQGKVAALCTMSDKDRLELLKDVAGIKVYEERRLESIALMEETNAKQELIAQVIDYIEKRLSELSVEKDELNACLNLERERRAIKYTIFVKELDDAKAALDQIDAERIDVSFSDRGARLDVVRAKIASLDRELASARSDLSDTTAERATMDKARREAIANIARLDVSIQDAEQVTVTAEETLRNAQAELASIEHQIDARRLELGPLQVNFNAANLNERNARSKVSILEAAIEAVEEKQLRKRKFNSAEERDAHLQEEIRKEQSARELLLKSKEKADSDCARLTAASSSNAEKIRIKRTELSSIKSKIQGLAQELGKFNKDLDGLVGHKKKKWIEWKDFESKEVDLMKHVEGLKFSKRAAFGSSMFRALEVVMNASNSDPDNLGPSRVYGALVDLIHVNDLYSTAAEVTAGSALTHIVVDTDKTAAQLVRLLQDKRAGRATFIPLNRLISEKRRDPRRLPEKSVDGVPLIDKIDYDANLFPAMDHIFGRTVITPDVDVGSRISKEYNMHCVTLEGDQVNKQGAMTGGFVDFSRSKIKASVAFRKGNDSLKSLQSNLADAKSAYCSSEAEIVRLQGEIQRLETNIETLNKESERLYDIVDQLSEYVRADLENLSKVEDLRSNLNDLIQTSDTREASAKTELGSPLEAEDVSDLTSELNSLRKEWDGARKDALEIAAQRANQESAIAAVQFDLETNLERRARELRKVIVEITTRVNNSKDFSEPSLPKLEDQRKIATVELDTFISELKSIDVRIAELEVKCSRITADLETLRHLENDVKKQLEEERSRYESVDSRRDIQMQKKSDSEQRIRDLGSLPSDFDKYRSMSRGMLLKKLKAANDDLSKLAQVNRKANDQFLDFSEQREVLGKRREEMVMALTSIRDLYNCLDQRKDEDILRTFKGVSKNFSDVFTELVPGGRASLVMQKSGGGGAVTNVDNDSNSKMQYTGIAVKVRFSETGDVYLLQQLSGGEKSIVALALIFAIQRLDPAPFCLFDEIDANLDPTYRDAVAALLKKQATIGNLQIVTTTFRPEVVRAGEKWFGVTHRNKVSSIREVRLETALSLINDKASPNSS